MLGLAATVITLLGVYFARDVIGPLVLGAVIVIIVMPVRLVLERWDSEEGPRSSLGVRGATLGHDLTRGFAHFTRCVRTAATGFEPAPSGSDRQEDPFAARADDDAGAQPALTPDVDEDSIDASADVEEQLGALEPATA